MATNSTAQHAEVKLKHQLAKLIQQLQHTLLEPSVSTRELQRAVDFFEPHHLDEVIEERHADGVCGWPLCSNKIDKSSPIGKYKISLSQKKVYDQSELRQYCDSRCYGLAVLCRQQIDTSPVETRVCTKELLAGGSKQQRRKHPPPKGKVPDVEQLAEEALKLKIVERDQKCHDQVSQCHDAVSQCHDQVSQCHDQVTQCHERVSHPTPAAGVEKWDLEGEEGLCLAELLEDGSDSQSESESSHHPPAVSEFGQIYKALDAWWTADAHDRVSGDGTISSSQQHEAVIQNLSPHLTAAMGGCFSFEPGTAARKLWVLVHCLDCHCMACLLYTSPSPRDS
eukprot:TRINITY_DN12317_c0_g2_i2.p1 TRINITY_DN12317_c0_g2~~TRINITY_DN12317_c0_g2_i2.p1  ORF type:complete len:338 (+),score=80.91 TRINITY_DN12317_c0_g2_i2:71-1084(+)